MDPDDVSSETRKDLIVIDMLSRVFCLRDVLENLSNFGRVVVASSADDETEKWKVVDFLTADRKFEEWKGEDRYTYKR